MAGTMNEADLVTDLKASLNDATSTFTAASDADFKRHLAVAALAFARIRPRTLVDSLTLVADQVEYTVPTDFVAFKSSLWGIAPRTRPQPWESTWTGRLPDVRYAEKSDGTKKLCLDPAPTAAQINTLGAEYRYYYYAGHVISATAANTTILPGERDRLLLRAQAEAMRELAIRGVKKPVSLRDGSGGSVSRHGTPGYLYEQMLDEFMKAAA